MKRYIRSSEDDMDYGYGFDDPEKNPEMIEKSKRVLDIAKKLECDIVTTHIHKVPVEECEQKEIRTIDKAPRAGAEGLQIAFLHPKATKGVLTELCEG